VERKYVELWLPFKGTVSRTLCTVHVNIPFLPALTEQVYVSHRDSSKISAVHKQAMLTGITGRNGRSCIIALCDVGEGHTSHGEVLGTRENAIAELGAGEP
jgi:hypothetical protein